ncbi:MAG TPA: hypothetical protein VF144_02775 [Chitinophagaceae bacterium]
MNQTHITGRKKHTTIADRVENKKADSCTIGITFDFIDYKKNNKWKMIIN